MSGGLVLRLRPHEKFLINGVVMENGDRRVRLRVCSQGAHILRFRDALALEDANTPAKRLYYLAQLAVIGDTSPEQAKEELIAGLKKLQEAFGDHPFRKNLEHSITEAHAGRFYHVMRALHRIFPIEAALLLVANSNANSLSPNKAV